MRDMNIQNTQSSHTEQREVQIGKTIYEVNTIFKGQQTLEQVLREWAITKVLTTANN